MPELDEHILHPGRAALVWRWIGTEVQADRSFVIAGGLATTAALGLAEAIAAAVAASEPSTASPSRVGAHSAACGS